MKQERLGSSVSLEKAMEVELLRQLLQGGLDVSAEPGINLSAPLKSVRVKTSADNTDVAGMLLFVNVCITNFRRASC